MTTKDAPANGGQGGAAALLDGQAATSTATAADWTAGLDDAGKGYVQNKGWKSPVDMFTSYQNLEKMRGVPAERLLTLPEKADDAEGWGAVWARLGRPETPDGYKLEGDSDSVKQLAAWMHEAGLPVSAAQSLAARMTEGGKAMAEAQTAAAQKASEAEVVELRKEWGAAFDQKTEQGRRFARELGLDQAALSAIESAIGTKRLLSMMAAGGEKLGEHRPAGFEPGTRPGGALTPEAAREKIASLHRDAEWSKRYLAGGAEESAEMQRLIRWQNGMP